VPADEQARRALGQAIRIARSRRQWTQKDLGQRSGVDQGYISDIERGERDLSFSTQRRLANALGLSVAQLMQAAEEEQSRQGDLSLHPDHDEAEPGG
jgi:transcriptional regulator with XRE-family HTH domain